MTDKTRYGLICSHCKEAFTTTVARDITFKEQPYRRLCTDCVYEIYNI